MFKKNSARGGVLNRLDKNYPKLIHKSGYNLFLCILTLIFILSTALALIPHSDPISPDLITDDAFTSDDTTSYVKVGEIWNGTEFDKTNLETLLRYVSGSSSISVTNLSPLTSNSNITELKGITAKQMQGYSVAGKPAGKDIVVTFAGLDFTPTYLSKDKSGNLILTIWLANSSQLAGKKFFVVNNKQEIKEYGSRSWNTGDFNHTGNLQDKFPDNMYGTSFINAVILNNGGYYRGLDLDVNMITKDSDNVFTPYTYNINITKYIVTPRQVTWQEFGQDKRFEFNGRNNFTLSNENWSTKITHDGIIDGDPTSTSYKFYTDSQGTYNYASKTYSDQWADSTLWLPSLSETGCGDSKVGIWSTSTSQRSNIYTTYLRSSWSSDTYEVCGLNSYGTAYTYGDVANWYAVRPALHLNLTLAAKNASPLLDERVSTNQSSPDGIYKVDKGSGVVEFHITSLKGMQYLYNYSREELENAYSTKWIFILDTDIDMNGYWSILGRSSSPFQGTFDGKGHTLSNVREPFYYVQNLTIQNLNLHNCNTLIDSAEVKVDIKNVVMTGECSPISPIFRYVRDGTFNVENFQLYPTNDCKYLFGDNLFKSTITFTKLFVIAPSVRSSNNGEHLTTVMLNDSFIHILDSSNSGFIFNVDIIMTNTSFYLYDYGSYNAKQLYVWSNVFKAYDSSIISNYKAAFSEKNKEFKGFYISDSNGIKVYDPNFTNSLWCQSNYLAGGLPQLKQFLIGGNAVANLNPSFNMQSWASKQMT